MFFLKFYFWLFLVWSEELQVNGYCATQVINPKHSCRKLRDFNRNSKYSERVSESEQSNFFNDFEGLFLICSTQNIVSFVQSKNTAKFYGMTWRNMWLHGATIRPYVFWNIIYQFHNFVWIILGCLNNLWIVHCWIVNRWIVYREIAQPYLILFT